MVKLLDNMHYTFECNIVLLFVIRIGCACNIFICIYIYEIIIYLHISPSFPALIRLQYHLFLYYHHIILHPIASLSHTIVLPQQRKLGENFFVAENVLFPLCVTSGSQAGDSDGAGGDGGGGGWGSITQRGTRARN